MIEQALRIIDFAEQMNVPIEFVEATDQDTMVSAVDNATDLEEFYRNNKYSLNDTVKLRYIYLERNNTFDPAKFIIEVDVFMKQNTVYTEVYSVERLRRIKETWVESINRLKESKKYITKLKNSYDVIPMSMEDKQELMSSVVQTSIVKEMTVEYKEFKLNEDNAKYYINTVVTTPILFYIEFVDSDGDSIIKLHEPNNKDKMVIEDRVPNHVYMKCNFQHEVIDVDLDIATSTVRYRYFKTPPDDIINELFKDFSKTEETIVSSQGHFNLNIENYSDFRLHYHIMINDLNHLVFIKEVSNPRTLKKNSKFYIRDIMNTNQYLMTFTIQNTIGNNYNIKFDSRNKQSGLSKYTPILLYQYMKMYEKMYTDVIDDYFVKPIQPEETMKGKTVTKIQNLRAKTDNIFLKDGVYTRNMCDCKSQPIIIDEEDKPEWEKFVNVDTKLNRIEYRDKLMVFPPTESGQLNQKTYVCPSTSAPFPILKRNTGANKKEYPYLPCCGSAPGLNQDSKYVSELFDASNITTKKNITYKSSHKISIKFQTFFKNILKVQPITPIIVKSTAEDSFMACVLYASTNYHPPIRKGIPNGKQIHENIEKMKQQPNQVKYCRDNISSFGIQTETVKQEMYNVSNNNILHMISSGKYIDSKQYYRFFEELLSINIITVYDDENGDCVVETPCYKDYHIRILKPEISTLFLYRGSNDTYSIISGPRNQMLFNNIYNLEQMALPYYATITDRDNNIFTRKTPFNHRWDIVFKDYIIQSQRINKGGKTYAINVQLKKESEPVSVYIPEAPPFNVPTDYTIGIIRDDSFITTKGEEGWYNDIFIPNVNLNMENVNTNFIIDLERNINRYDSSHLFDLKRHNSILFCELLEWLWLVSNPNTSMNEWITQHLVKTSVNNKEFETYKLKVSSYVLPTVTNTFDGIEWIKHGDGNFENIFKDKIYIYDQLYDRIVNYLKLQEHRLTDLKPPTFIKSGLLKVENYTRNKEEKIFLSFDDFDKWRLNKNDNIEMYETIESRPHNYVYNDIVNHKIKLILNSNNIYTAFMISLEWKKGNYITESDIEVTEKIINFVKNSNYIVYDTKLNKIKENTIQLNLNQDIIELIFYEDTNTYSTFIDLNF